LITFGFALDKYGRVRAEIGIACFLLGAIICYKRLTTAKIFDKTVHYAITTYDIIITFFYLVIALHLLSETTLYISTLVIAISCILTFIIICIILSEKKTKEDLDRLAFSAESRLALVPLHAERLMYYLYKSITDDDPSERIHLNNLIANHLSQCENRQCQCVAILNDLERHDLHHQLEEW
jgi:hypothetical protein